MREIFWPDCAVVVFLVFGRCATDLAWRIKGPAFAFSVVVLQPCFFVGFLVWCLVMGFFLCFASATRSCDGDV